MDTPALDTVLQLQLVVAWAGEAKSDPPRLAWWRTAMIDEFGGHDLLQRLAPNTWRWAALEAAREAARRVDDHARNSSEDADHLVSLFRLGFELDERLDDRLRELKQRVSLPAEAFPELQKLIDNWSRAALEAWLGRQPVADYTGTATGRRLKGDRPTDVVATATQLAAALLPLAEKYPLPHFRVAR